MPAMIRFPGKRELPIKLKLTVVLRIGQPVKIIVAEHSTASCGGQGKRYGRASIRGNHMNLGGPSAPGFADGLWAVFFKAPVPSG